MRYAEQKIKGNKIRGIEQEYPVSVNALATATSGLNPSLLVNSVIRGLKRRRFLVDVPWDVTMEVSQEEHESKISSSYGDNGSRIYNDMGHLEIATPSYNNPFDAVAYDKASEIYAFIGSREASLSLKKKIVIHKNNVANFFTTPRGGPGKGKEKRGRIKTNTYATHGNIITKRAACKDWSRVERALIPWVVARILFTGSGDVVSGGCIGKGDKSVKFVISPRAIFVREKSSLSTTSRRGILNTRDQPHAAHQYWRLHDIHYEALRSEYAIFLRDIAQALVISAFESGFLDDAPELEDPVSAFKELSLDTRESEWKMRLKNGEMTDAVSILEFYLNAIEEMQESEGIEVSKWDEIGLNCLKDLVKDLEARRLDDYVDGIDWVTKLALLVNYEPKSPSEGISICNQYAVLDESVLYLYFLGLDDEKRSIDTDKRDCPCLFNPEDSLAFAKSKLRQVDWSSLPERVRYAVGNAPEQTRDFFRAKLLKGYGSQIRRVNWSKLVLDEATILLDEPFMLNKEEMEMEMELDVEVGGEMIRNADADLKLKDILAKAKRLYPDKVSFSDQTF